MHIIKTTSIHIRCARCHENGSFLPAAGPAFPLSVRDVAPLDCLLHMKTCDESLEIKNPNL